jgi:ADP-ribose pyrophosphatase
MEETIVSTQEIYHGRVVHLVIYDVTLPDGSRSKREVVNHPGAVAIVALDDKQKVLMVRQFRLPARKVLWEIPAGTRNEDEAPEACANRELQEETGYKPGKLEYLGGFFVAPGYTSEYIHLFLATQLTESRLKADDDEFLEIERLPFAEALAMIERGDIVDGKTISGLLRVARRLKL